MKRNHFTIENRESTESAQNDISSYSDFGSHFVFTVVFC